MSISFVCMASLSSILAISSCVFLIYLLCTLTYIYIYICISISIYRSIPAFLCVYLSGYLPNLSTKSFCQPIPIEAYHPRLVTDILPHPHPARREAEASPTSSARAWYCGPRNLSKVRGIPHAGTLCPQYRIKTNKLEIPKCTWKTQNLSENLHNNLASCLKKWSPDSGAHPTHRITRNIYKRPYWPMILWNVPRISKIAKLNTHGFLWNSSSFKVTLKVFQGL